MVANITKIDKTIEATVEDNVKACKRFTQNNIVMTLNGGKRKMR